MIIRLGLLCAALLLYMGTYRLLPPAFFFSLSPPIFQASLLNHPPLSYVAWVFSLHLSPFRGERESCASMGITKTLSVRQDFGSIPLVPISPFFYFFLCLSISSYFLPISLTLDMYVSIKNGFRWLSVTSQRASPSVVRMIQDCQNVSDRSLFLIPFEFSLPCQRMKGWRRKKGKVSSNPKNTNIPALFFVVEILLEYANGRACSYRPVE